jgi:ribosomal protein S18 acetylase RimI-like enzyme
MDRRHEPGHIMQDWDNYALHAVWAQEQGNSISSTIDVKLELLWQGELDTEDRETCFAIIEHTSRDDYESSSIGWRYKVKKQEMTHPALMYILVRAAPGTQETFAPGFDSDIIGFASFMLTQDDPPHEHRTVAYIYEVHLGEKFRGKGIGTFLVWTIEAMADTAGLTKVMLTVFNCNTGAIEAYKKMGYAKDEASPRDIRVRSRTIEADYMIMSKTWSRDGPDIHSTRELYILIENVD